MELDFELELGKGLVQDHANESVPETKNVEQVLSLTKQKHGFFAARECQIVSYLKVFSKEELLSEDAL